MTFFAFGDSFTKGIYHDGNSWIENDAPFIKTLAELFGTGYHNLAKSGCSNLDICREITSLEHRIDPDKDFVFVGWSGLARGGPDNGNNVFFSAMSMRYISDLLTKKNIKHVMISAFVDHKTLDFNLTKDEVWPNWIEYDKYNNTLIDICADTWLVRTDRTKTEDFNLTNSREFARVEPNSYVGPCQHPTQAGHDLIAQTLFKYFGEAMHA